MRFTVRPPRTVIVALLVSMFVLVSATSAAASTAVPISGYEISPGLRIGLNTYGVVFAGWTTSASVWVAPPGNGGKWAASINYSGTAGIGAGPATILSGRASGYWTLRTAAGTLSGRVIGGEVKWPTLLAADIGCGPGVATFLAAVSIGITNVSTQAGLIQGCLDDTHLADVFPPRVWGTLVLN